MFTSDFLAIFRRLLSNSLSIVVFQRSSYDDNPSISNANYHHLFKSFNLLVILFILFMVFLYNSVALSF